MASKKTRIAATLALAISLALGTTAALAHDDAQHATAQAPNGGQLRAAGNYQFELVLQKDAQEAKESPVLVYLSDHDGKKIASAGASGTVTILAGKLKANAVLQPDGDNRLKGLAKYASTPDWKAVVSITLPGKPPEQARFMATGIAMGGPKDAASPRKP